MPKPKTHSSNGQLRSTGKPASRDSAMGDIHSMLGRIAEGVKSQNEKLRETTSETNKMAATLKETAGQAQAAAVAAEQIVSSVNEMGASVEQVTSNMTQVAAASTQTTASIKS